MVLTWWLYFLDPPRGLGKERILRDVETSGWHRRVVVLRFWGLGFSKIRGTIVGVRLIRITAFGVDPGVKLF